MKQTFKKLGYWALLIGVVTSVCALVLYGSDMLIKAVLDSIETYDAVSGLYDIDVMNLYFSSLRFIKPTAIAIAAVGSITTGILMIKHFDFCDKIFGLE